MPKRAPVTAGEVVSWFEEVPTELAKTVFDIVRVRLQKRLPKPSESLIRSRKRGRPVKVEAEGDNAG